jgi:hypothetical protein
MREKSSQSFPNFSFLFSEKGGKEGGGFLYSFKKQQPKQRINSRQKKQSKNNPLMFASAVSIV